MNKIKKCKICKEDFLLKSNNQRFCNECGIKHEKKRVYEYYKKYNKNNKEKVKSYKKKWRENNKEYPKQWKQKNKRKFNEYQKKYIKSENGKIKYNEYQRQYQTEQRKNPLRRIDDNFSNNMRISLKGKKKGRSWEKLVGYTLQDLVKHLENKFENWMNWDNYGEWEIDHIKPKSLFKYKNTEDLEFKKCWSLENLQPLEKSTNRKKHNSYYY